jgi:hypothetical protein
MKPRHYPFAHSLAPALIAADAVVEADATVRSGFPARNFGLLSSRQADSASRAFIRRSNRATWPRLRNQLPTAYRLWEQSH